MDKDDAREAQGYVARVSAIVQNDDPDEFTVRFRVCSTRDIGAGQGADAKGEEPPVIHSFVYEMVVRVAEDDCSMAPDDNLEECMEILHEYEFDDNLNPRLRRMWKTAYLADSIADRIFSSGLLEVWDSEEE